MSDDRRAELKKIITDTKALPTLHGVIDKLNAVFSDSRTSMQEMARIVSADQALSARILRLANSPSYGFYRISTISNAMILLGVDVVKSLVVSSSIFEIMEESSVGLWEHSMATATAAGVIARKLGVPEVEEITTAGLLHDIGKAIIDLKCPEQARTIRTLVNEKGQSELVAEREVLDTDHTEVGNWLAESWCLPEKLVEPIANHHNVAASAEHQLKTAVVHLADIVAKASGFGDSGDLYVPEIQPVAWHVLKLDENKLREIVIEFEDKLVEVKNFSLEIQGINGKKA